jgi:succinate-semialdehyde dehydrogenase/glutarate-semialdehyde dehydrogenase
MFSLKQYINGELVEGKGSPISVVCPGTGEVIGEVKAVSAEQAQQALEAARDAFPAWSALPLEARGAWMLKLAAAVEEEKGKLAEIMAYETGKFYPHSFGEVSGISRSLQFFLDQAKSNYDETIRDPMDRNLFLSVREPLGVVVAYIAWNFPMGKIGRAHV